MNLNQTFQIASGTVAGRDHLLKAIGSQDSITIIEDPDLIIGVVCDGCGSHPHSDVGAKLGGRIIANNIKLSKYVDNIKYYLEDNNDEFLSTLRNAVMYEMKRVIDIGKLTVENEKQSTFVMDYLLFTIICFVITPEDTVIFGLGDGTYVLNGEIKRLGPFPGNAPPYLAYAGLVQSSKHTPEQLMLQIYESLPTAELQSLVVGSDGLDYLEDAADKNLPGRSEVVGHISQFWTQDKFYKNPDMLRRRLAMINTDKQEISWNECRQITHAGHLKDDTTMIVVRRNPEFISEVKENDDAN